MPTNPAAIVTTILSAILGVVVSFHIAALTPAETGGLLGLAVAGVGLGLYGWSLLHAWATSTYDTARVTTLVTAVLSEVIAVLTAFGVYKPADGSSFPVLVVAQAIAIIGGLLFSYLHAAQVKAGS